MAIVEIASSGKLYDFPNGYFEFDVNKETDTYTMSEDTFVNGSDISTSSRPNGDFDRTRVYEGDMFFNETIYGNDDDNRIYGAAEFTVSWLGERDIRYGDETALGALKTWSWDGDFDDFIHGAGGADTIVGRKGDDHLIGGDGNDVIYGGEGSDQLKGADHNDLIYTGPLDNGETDWLAGGDGGDTFFLGDSTANANSSNVFTEGGIDWANLALSLAGDVSNLAFTIAPGVGSIGQISKAIVPMIFDVAKAVTNGGETVEAPVEGETGSATISDFNPIEDVIFIPLPSDGDIYIDQNSNENNLLQVMYDTNSTDVIATVELSDDLSTLEGYSSDTLQEDWFSILERQALIIDSEDARDYKNNTQLNIDDEDLEDLGENQILVLGAYGGFEVSGSNEVDYMYGTQHNDILAGYETEDEAYTANNDVFYGFGGEDEFSGGEGNDRIYGGDGSDTANYSHSTGGINVNLSLGTADDDGFGTDDKLFDIENIVGSDVGDDTITGDDQANVIYGLGGDDSLDGGEDNDTIDGGEDNDTIDGGDGDDSLDGGIGNDNLDGGENNDSLEGNDGNDILKGNNGEDTLDGNDGNDTLAGGADNDFLYGGADNDFLYGGANDDVLYGELDDDFLYGGADDDTLYGGLGLDQLFGGQGYDYLNGGGNADNLLGQNGDDTLSGGNGVDFLTGGHGNDYLIGGYGADRFMYSDFVTGIDTIADFDGTEGDMIEIDMSVYNVSSIDDLSYDSSTGELSVSNLADPIAILQNPIGFELSSDYISLVE
ncbi:MAG: hypothetical protein F6K08_28390 [Okeania sp. SIO1H6]|nr:hypothetical protein [Okeania sp. SIO1H6]